MLSKEEIENMKRYFNECIKKDTVYEEGLTINFIKIAKEYIGQLESELEESRKETMQIYDDYQDIGKLFFDLDEKVQKLIEKLEKEKYTIESTYSQINGNYFMAQDRLNLINEILSLLKGEKEWKIK